MGTILEQNTNGRSNRTDSLSSALPTREIIDSDTICIRTRNGVIIVRESARGQARNRYREIGKKSQEQIEAEAEEPITARILVDLGYLDSFAEEHRMFAANRKLNALAGRVDSSIRRVGAAYGPGKNGRNCWQSVYCIKWIHGNKVQHEYDLTRLLLAWEPSSYQRTHVPFNADALIVIENDHYLLELERGTNNAKDIKKRCAAFSGPYTILWVCKDEKDLKDKMRWTAAVRDRSLYTTFDQAVEDPHREIWVSPNGLLVEIPRAGEPVSS